MALLDEHSAVHAEHGRSRRPRRSAAPLALNAASILLGVGL